MHLDGCVMVANGRAMNQVRVPQYVGLSSRQVVKIAMQSERAQRGAQATRLREAPHVPNEVPGFRSCKCVVNLLCESCSFCFEAYSTLQFEFQISQKPWVVQVVSAIARSHGLAGFYAGVQATVPFLFSGIVVLHATVLFFILRCCALVMFIAIWCRFLCANTRVSCFGSFLWRCFFSGL